MIGEGMIGDQAFISLPGSRLTPAVGRSTNARPLSKRLLQVI